jgi:hypothetical protein
MLDIWQDFDHSQSWEISYHGNVPFLQCLRKNAVTVT